MFKKNTTQAKTKPSVMFTINALFIVVPFLAVWLTVGEVDLLNLDWIVSHNGSLWRGNVHNNQTLIDWLIKTYNPKTQPQISDGYIAIKNDGNIWLNNNIFIYALLPLFSGIILPIFLIVLKKGQIDIYPFTISIGIGCFVFIICGLIPMETNGLKWFLSLIIAFVIVGICFLTLNKIFNAILSTTKIGVRMAIDLQSDSKIMNKYNEDLKELVNSQTNKDNIEYIETEK